MQAITFWVTNSTNGYFWSSSEQMFQHKVLMFALKCIRTPNTNTTQTSETVSLIHWRLRLMPFSAATVSTFSFSLPSKPAVVIKQSTVWWAAKIQRFWQLCCWWGKINYIHWFNIAGSLGKVKRVSWPSQRKTHFLGHLWNKNEVQKHIIAPLALLLLNWFGGWHACAGGGALPEEYHHTRESRNYDAMMSQLLKKSLASLRLMDRLSPFFNKDIEKMPIPLSFLYFIFFIFTFKCDV